MHASGLILVALLSTPPRPAPAPLPDATASQRGAVSTTTQFFSGTKSFSAVDAGVVITGVLEGPFSSTPVRMTLHNGANTFDNAMVWDVSPANVRDLDTFNWSNGGLQGMGLNLGGATQLNIYGAVSPYVINNKSGGSVSPIMLTSNLNGAATTSAIFFDQTTARANASCQYSFANAGVVYACFEPYPGYPTAPVFSVSGSMSAAGDTSHGSYQVGQNGSGTVAMQCTDVGNGCYLPMLCTESANYNTHGCVAIGNTGHLDGGMVLQVENPGGLGFSPAATTDNVFTVDVFGGFGQPMRAGAFPGSAHAFPLCPDRNAPNNTFGQGTSSSMLHWASDRNSYYVCRSELNDAGTTGSGTGYVQMLDQAALFPGETVDISERGGTSAFSTGTKAITFAPAFGSGTPHCVCTSVDSAGTALACSRNTVSTSGATFVGSGSNAFDWHCWGKRF